MSHHAPRDPSARARATPESPQANAARSRRRVLVRAGLAGAATLGSLGARSVLANPFAGPRASISMWSSVQLAGPLMSQQTRMPGGNVRGPANWQGMASYTGFADSAANTSFTNELSNGRISAGFAPHAFKGKSLPQVLNAERSSEMAQLAKYCVAMYLNACSDGNTLSASVMTKETAQLIWRNKGVWTPVVGGATWTLVGTLEYFDYICLGAEPMRWTA